MAVPEGLKNSLNAIREISSEIYHRYIPIIDSNTDISVFSTPIMEYKEVQNEFISGLINRIVYTGFTIKYFRNPLQVLEGDRIPLGSAGQEIYTNPAKGRRYNGEDFAGLLAKYEADVKVQYMALNMDTQYPVTINRQTLKQAFVSWGDLETFIEQLSNSLYNGAYIDEFNFTKNIIAGAYKDNKAVIQTITAITTADLAKAFVTKARELFLNFQTPSTQYNSWGKIGGYGRPIKTWTNPEDIVFIVRNDIRAYLDVNILANAFNLDKTSLLGNIITVDNFDVYDDDGQKVYDGSKIVGMIADKSWFRIKKQDMFLDTFYNPNNRSWQYYLNLIKMYNFSLFANGVIFATEAPTVAITDLDFVEAEPTVEIGKTLLLHLKATPFQGTTSVTFTSGTTATATVEKVDDRTVKVTGVDDGTSVITATAGSVTATVTVTVPEATA